MNNKETHRNSSNDNRAVKRPIFLLEDVIKRWDGEPGFVLKIPDLRIYKGEKVAFMGMSGCGKSTLLDLLAMILRPDSAKAFHFSTGENEPLNVNDAWQRKDLDKLALTRMLYMGYVLQTGGLLPFLSVRDNIGLCRKGLGLPVSDAVETIAEKLGISRHLDKMPDQLSVGERQRVAIARAMANNPSIVIADEPTASLDPINAEEIMNLFIKLVEEHGVTLVVATHEWDRLDEYGFRRIKFNLEKNATEGTVQAIMSG